MRQLWLMAAGFICFWFTSPLVFCQRTSAYYFIWWISFLDSVVLLAAFQLLFHSIVFACCCCRNKQGFVLFSWSYPEKPYVDQATDLRDSKTEAANKRDVCFCVVVVFVGSFSIDCAIFQMFSKFSLFHSRTPLNMPASIIPSISHHCHLIH